MSSARSLNGTSSDWMKTTSAIDLSFTSILTVSFWLWWNAFLTDDQLAIELTTNNNSFNTGFNVDPNDSGARGLGCALLDSSGYNAAFITPPSAQSWHHYAITFDKASASVSVNAITGMYVDGVAQTLTNQLKNPCANKFANDNLYFMNRGGASLFANGRIAHVALWNVQLLANELAALGGGVSPLRIRPLSLKFYWPIWGAFSPELPLIANNPTITVTGTTPAAGPPVSFSSRRFIGSAPFIQDPPLFGRDPFPMVYRTDMWDTG
jgi:hypothetical protein